MYVIVHVQYWDKPRSLHFDIKIKINKIISLSKIRNAVDQHK